MNETDTDFPVCVNANGQADLGKWIIQNKASTDKTLKRAGAILFRGFDVPGATQFDEAIEAYGAPNFTYADSLSNAVRTNVTQRVFTANEAPPDVSIYLHHEMAQTPIYPAKLFFYCEIAPQMGGATPLCRSDVLIEAIARENQALVQSFEEKGVRYTNIMPENDDAASGQGRSWRSTLSAQTKEQAQTRLSDLGYEYSWHGDGSLQVTTPRLDAVRLLEDGRKVFFNQLIAAFRGWSDARNDPSKSITYGDDTPINGADMQIAIDLADELTYDLNWQAGDVALIDNFLVMHGRRPYKGSRRVLASLIA